MFRSTLVAVSFFLTAVGSAGDHPLMPLATDHTQMWWAEGFPNHVPGTPWLREIETGNYRMVMNTETLEISELAGGAAELELVIRANGKRYSAKEGGKWTRFSGPRLIESGRFFQRSDITDLVFKSDDGELLNTEARIEIAAWPDRLSFVLAAEPGVEEILGGKASFGKVGGGYGFDGTNELVIPHSPELDLEKFTLEMWTFVPSDYMAGRASPWLVCKNRNEAANGNFGIMIVNGKAVAQMNVDGAFEVESRPLKLDAWSKLTLSYDGEIMRLFINEREEGQKKIGRARKPGNHALCFGRREDNHGDGYHFRGIIDEVKLFDGEKKLIREWGFGADGVASEKRMRGVWKDSVLEMTLKSEKGTLHAQSAGEQVHLAFDPVDFKVEAEGSPVTVTAFDRPVEFDPALGWHRINLDGVEPTGEGNDAMEHIKFKLANPTESEQIARLMFEKTAHGFRQRTGTPITGVSAILRDENGNPTGIPVQLSKNWHNDPAGGVYASQWFHGISQIRLPPGCRIDVELVLAYGHWGGVPAASHAQLSLIGWGGNTLWDQSALGSWGESICYDPDQAQANSTVTDVRPMMVTGMGNRAKWGWTQNVGGADFFRLFNPAGKRVAHSAMRTNYLKHGPCLTEVTYAGGIGKEIAHSVTVSLGRTDDIVRGTYRIRMDVKEGVDVQRFVIFQMGSDTYNATGERKLAIGDAGGLQKEWDTQWGGNVYRTEPMKMEGRMPWASLHEGVPRENEKGGAIANRGLVIREWKAKLGGKETAPWMAERGLTIHKTDSSTLDIVPQPGVHRLEAGDFVEATIEHIVMPQFANDYYGPNEALRVALAKDANTWRMIFREAKGNDRVIEMTKGKLVRIYPDVKVQVEKDEAALQVKGGIGYVPLTFTGLSSWRGSVLKVNGEIVPHWQCDYDADTRTWSRTYNVPCGEGEVRNLHLAMDQPNR